VIRRIGCVVLIIVVMGLLTAVLAGLEKIVF